MTENLQPYPEYQPSNVPWLGQVPAHWRLIRSKYTLVEKSIKGYPNEPLLAATQRHGVILKEHYENRTVVANTGLENLKLVEVGDFVISLRSFEGGIEIAHNRGIISPAYTVIAPTDKQNRDYFVHLFKSKPFIDGLKLCVTGIREGQNIDYGRLQRVFIPVPPPDEQEAIVRFLDQADRRIRRYIKAKRRLIKLLEEQKQGIIQQAVTRGLDPDVPMKESGVEWLGEIPSHWEEKRAKYFFHEIDIRSETGNEELLSVSHLTGVTPRSQKNITMFKAESYVGYKLCFAGDLVINTMWAWMGALGVSEQTGIVSSSYAVYRQLNADFLPSFVDHVLRIKPYISEYICLSRGIRSSRLRLYPDQFFTIPILCPPLDEQMRIVEYIQSLSEATDTAIENIKLGIANIQGYQLKLIADVVTGKLDVRKAAAHLPGLLDEVDDLDEEDLFKEEELDEEWNDSED